MAKPETPQPQPTPERPDVDMVMETLTHSDNSPSEKRG